MKYIPIVFLLLFSACVVQFAGITNDYDKLTAAQKVKIKKLTDFSATESGLIYELNSIQLIEDLAKNEKSLVYSFANRCNSKYCVPLQTVVNYAEINNYKLYLIMNGYSGLDVTEKQNIDKPLFALDFDYYNSKRARVCWEAFRNYIGLTEFLGEEKYLGSYLFFEGNKLVEVKRTLD